MGHKILCWPLLSYKWVIFIISTIGNISNHKQDFKICRRVSYTNLQKFPFYDNKIQAPLDL